MACTHSACLLSGALPASADERVRCRRRGQALLGHAVPAAIGEVDSATTGAPAATAGPPGFAAPGG
eukprot:3692512-Pyramimonas_sp.AAC.1